MRYITLDYIKAHSRLDELRQGEDELIEEYAESAEDTVLNYLGRSYESLVEEYGKVPAPVRHATVMLVDLSYMMRSPISMTNFYEVPYTFEALIKPYMIL